MCKIYVVKHFVAMLLLIQPLREEEPWLTVWSHAAQKVGGDKNPTEERCNRGKFLLRYQHILDMSQHAASMGCLKHRPRKHRPLKFYCQVWCSKGLNIYKKMEVKVKANKTLNLLQNNHVQFAKSTRWFTFQNCMTRCHATVKQRNAMFHGHK